MSALPQTHWRPAENLPQYKAYASAPATLCAVLMYAYSLTTLTGEAQILLPFGSGRVLLLFVLGYSRKVSAAGNINLGF